ncbi:MAG TPA: type II toxin-antitoxin system VapC family toxin [Candidatus Thermoplasmatota archaeon]|nr:type II toxin-antitoxin system VapC family toxin [Candidatus Thermoplasmatota archaeon]
MFVADTTFLIDVARGLPEADAVLAEIEASGELLATTFISMVEFLRGNRHAPKARRVRGVEFMNRLVVLDGDVESARLAAQADEALSAKGTRVPLIDLLIAGIAIRVGGTILTRDRDLQGVPGLAARPY